jgi:hypothetical protein
MRVLVEGVAIIKAARESGVQTPILVLAVRGAVSDKVAALEPPARPNSVNPRIAARSPLIRFVISAPSREECRTDG